MQLLRTDGQPDGDVYRRAEQGLYLSGLRYFV